MHASPDRPEDVVAIEPRAAPPMPLLAWGSVRHARLAPVHHAFAYPCPFLMLPMRSLAAHPAPALRRNGRAWFTFHDADHGDGGPDALAWADAVLARAGVDGADGELWLQTLPRVAGYAFKPVSFWFAHDRAGRLKAVLAEVHNTFGERHAYVLQGGGIDYGRTLGAGKAFHVSPFCEVKGEYRFRFMRRPADDGSGERVVARVEWRDAGGRDVLHTSLSGLALPLSARRVRQLVWRMPFAALAVTARIHRQAVALWLKRVPWFAHPGAARADVTLGGAAPAPTPLRESWTPGRRPVPPSQSTA